ncbi:hypothetical protein IST455A_05772 [Burkholderia multivorans]|nr:hypothetical protein IST455A_05772 [Burkholderia multivorans]CAB5318186.1 hypothetical protein IST495B_02858 [Burkholderia multivorans]CAB5338067.1 hypothetical protein IST4119_05137 [Burkholderia multivorans]
MLNTRAQGWSSDGLLHRRPAASRLAYLRRGMNVWSHTLHMLIRL